MDKSKSGTRQPWRAYEADRRHADNIIKAAEPGWRRCLRLFAAWLEENRGLTLSTITVRIRSARTFLQGLSGVGVRSLRVLDSANIEDFAIDYARDHGAAARRSMQAAMRLFLRFAAYRKWVRSDLAESVPSQQSYKLSGVPQGVSNDDVCKLLSSPQNSARDAAILLLLATYGIRRGQACALRLEDVNWRDRTVFFRAHKGGKSLIQDLTAAVAEKLSEYIRHERPVVNEQAIFLRVKRPYLPLSPGAVTWVVKSAVGRSGIDCASFTPHALRHAFATRLLHRGQPLKVIADLLGHRSLGAVSIYAKIDHPRLREVAGEWPEVTS